MKYKTVKIPEELYQAINSAIPGDSYDWKLEVIITEYLEDLIQRQEKCASATKKHLTSYYNEKIAQRTEYKPDF